MDFHLSTSHTNSPIKTGNLLYYYCYDHGYLPLDKVPLSDSTLERGEIEAPHTWFLIAADGFKKNETTITKYKI